jgi:hypothetical protein
MTTRYLIKRGGMLEQTAHLSIRKQGKGDDVVFSWIENLYEDESCEYETCVGGVLPCHLRPYIPVLAKQFLPYSVGTNELIGTERTVELATVAGRKDNYGPVRASVRLVCGNSVREYPASDMKTPVVIVLYLGHCGVKQR